MSLCLPFFGAAQVNRVVVGQPDQFALKRGTSATQTLRVTVLEGFHVNSNKPKDEFLIPLKLTWEPGPVEAKSIEYPKAEEITVGGEQLVVFTGSFNIDTHFQAAAGAAPGATKLTGKLRYQACNNTMCFRPVSVDVSLPVLVQ